MHIDAVAVLCTCWTNIFRCVTELALFPDLPIFLSIRPMFMILILRFCSSQVDKHDAGGWVFIIIMSLFSYHFLPTIAPLHEGGCDACH